MRIAIITKDNGKGLTRDAKIFRDLSLELGHDARIISFDRTPPKEPIADIAIFLELYHISWSRAGFQILLVPNEEWYPKEYVPFLSTVDLVLAKSVHALGIFREAGSEVEFLGMTSLDRWLDCDPQERLLHTPGNSLYKGTASVVGAYLRPEARGFPEIEIPVREQRFTVRLPTNVRVIEEYVTEPDLRRKQNETLLLVQPSECEGYGHAIAEALSAGRPVLTIDAPPMNELVDRSRGYLVDWKECIEANLGERYMTTASAVARAISEALDDREELERRGRNARAYWQEADASFRWRYGDIISQL